MVPPVTAVPAAALTLSEDTPLPELEPMAAAIVTLELFADSPAFSTTLNAGIVVPVDEDVIELLTVMLLAASNDNATVVETLKLKIGAIVALTMILPVPPVLPLLVVIVTSSPACKAALIVPVSTVPAVV